MLKWIWRIGAGLVVLFGITTWWLLISGSDAAKTAPGIFDIEDWRNKATAEQASLPIKLRIIEIGRDTAPAFAAQAGRFGENLAMSYNTVEIVFPDRSIIVGGAVDRKTAEGMTQSKTDWRFSDAAYETLTDTMLSADQVLMTHEHLDHVMAIARHPEPNALAARLVLNAPQIEALPLFAEGELDPVLKSLEPRLTGAVETIAPGVVVIPAAGHTPGSQTIYVKLQSGAEILLIGDIVWTMDAIKNLKTRPVLTQYVVFRPNYEDRDAIKKQVRALHDMAQDNPGLAILPAHDRSWLIQQAEKPGIEFIPVE